MLDLEKHINDLLYNYDCVIVPGLGGFVANNKSATLNEKTGIFSPPRREIGFNKSLSHNDGLLTSHIANADGISFEDCSRKMAQHINILKYQLNQGASITIGSAGELKNDAQGNTLFTPNLAESFSMDSFGLSTFHFNTLNQVKEQNETSRRWVRRTLQSKNVRQVAASVTLMVGMLFVTPEFGNQTQQSTFTDFLPKKEYHVITANAVSDATIDNMVPETKSAMDINNAAAQASRTAVVSNKTQNTYFIIGASFKKEHQAQAFLNKLVSKGIADAEIIASNNRFRVSLKGFSDKQTAIEALENHRKKNGPGSAWLLKHSH